MPWLPILRYWLPLAVCVVGFALAAARGFDDTGLDTMSAMFGAGGSIWLLNLLLRMGFSGDRERDDEDEARAFFDRHGLWPDEVPPGWTPPAEAGPGPRRPPHKAAAPATPDDRHRARRGPGGGSSGPRRPT